MAIRTVFGNREGREKKNLANKEYYKTLVEGKKEATFLSDTDGDLFLLNKKAQQLTGFSEEEIRELHVRDIFVTLRNTENPFDSHQFSEFTSRFYLLDTRRYLLPVMVDFKEIEGQKFLCTCVEVAGKEIASPDREMPAQFQDEMPVVVQPLPANDNHLRWPVDFEHTARNLLNNMLGFGSILARDPAITEDKKLSVNLDSLIKSGNQLKKLFNQLSAGEADTYEVVKTPVKLYPVLQKAGILLDPVARQNNQSIQIRQTGDFTVFTDEFLLLELLKFLLEKALFYTRNDEVMVDVGDEPSTGKVVITIDNLGQDIPQGIINFIKRGNSKEAYDLGNPVIAQNQEIRALLHNLNRIDARISFSTGSSLGEIARIILPLSTENENTDDLSILENAIRSKGLKILIVEDEKFTARILRLYLEEISEVSLAYSGNEALNIAEIFYSKGIIFNAVIMDVGLPKPWDGILLKKEIEKRWPEYQNVPFLAQTAFTAKSYTDRIAENKFMGHLLKPVSRSDVLRFIDKYCK